VKLTLYYRPGTCALASFLALEEAGADYDAVDVTDRPDLLASLNPRGKVPVLEVDGRTLRENIAILSFIARRYPAASLLPQDPFEEAQCLSTAAWFASTLHIDYRRFLKPAVYSPEHAARQAISAEGALQYSRDLDELDRQLRGKTWLHGEQRSIADLYGLVFVDWAHRSALYDPGWTSIGQWAERLRQRPAVARVLKIMGSPLVAGDKKC
jgi:glutathione S-transferase